MDEYAADELLCRCLRASGSRQALERLLTLDAAAWEVVVEEAMRHGVAPLLHTRMREQSLEDGIPGAPRHRLRAAYVATAGQNARLYDELADALNALQGAGIPVIVLKGAHLAERIYGNIALRPMTDIDLLVPWEQVEQADAILKSIGYGSLNLDRRKEQERERREHLAVGHQLPAHVNEETGTPIELHWDFVSRFSPLQVDMGGVWTRARPETLAGVETRVLSPEDLLLHISVHAAYQHSFAMGLLPLCDIASCVEHYGEGIQWRELRRIADAQGVREVVFYALLLARRMLAARVPEPLLRALRPRRVDRRLVEELSRRVLSVPRLRQVRAAFTRPPESVLRPVRANAARNRWRTLLRAALPSPERLCALYALPPGSRQAYIYYPRYVLDMCRERVGAMVQACVESLRTGASLRSAANRIVVHNWIVSEVRRRPGHDDRCVRIGEHVFTVDVMDTPEQWRKGMGGRAELPCGYGLWFVYPRESMHSFWMKGCKFPLDVLFVTARGEIVALHTMEVEPIDTPESALRSYGSNRPARFALEVAAGTCQALGIEVGQHVDIPAPLRTRRRR